jgi:hypothetical protein
VRIIPARIIMLAKQHAPVSLGNQKKGGEDFLPI